MPAVMEDASRHQQQIKTHLHDKSPTDDMGNCSIVKFVCGLIVEIFLVGAYGLQQLQYVVGIQSAGLGGHAAGQVRVANVCYSLLKLNHKVNHKYILQWCIKHKVRF